MDVDIEAVLEMQQRIESLKRYIAVLKHEKAELVAEIGHHHEDFLRIRGLLAEANTIAYPGSDRDALKKIGNIVG